MKKMKLIYFITIVIFAFLLLSSAGCVSTPTKLDEKFYSSIKKIGSDIDSIYYFTLPNGISVYLYQQPKNEADYESSALYNTLWISYIFKNLAVSMTDLPPGTQYALADILYYIPGKKYDSDKIEKLYNSGYLSTIDYEMTEDYYRINIASSPTYFSSYLTDIPEDILNKSIPDNLDYKSLAKSYTDFLKKKEYDLNFLVYRLTESNAFQNTFYSHTLDSQQTYSRLSKINIVNLYKRLIQPKNLTIIIRGGKISPQAAANIIWEKFSFLKNSNSDIDKIKITEIDPSRLNKKNFAYAISKDSKNSLIAGYFPGPLLESNEVAPFVVALNILSKRLFINVRIKNNGAYQIDAFPYFLKQTWGNILYNTTDINSSMKNVRLTIQELKKDGINDEELEGFKNYFLTVYYLYQSYGKDKFNLFYNSIVKYENGFESFYLNYLKTYLDINKESVNNIIKKYFNYFYWGLVTPDENTIKSIEDNLFFYNP
jgi:predicted Zn-dependent peptidase